MKILISYVVQQLVSNIRIAYAKDALEKYLGAYIRPELFEKVKIDQLLKSLYKQASGRIGDIDENLFYEDMVDYLISKKFYEEVKAIMLTAIQSKHGYPLDDLKAVLTAHKTLTKEQKDILDKTKDEFGKLMYSNLEKFLKNGMREWVREHQTESPYLEPPKVTEKGLEEEGEVKVDMPEPELDAGIAEETTGVNEGIIKNALRRIHQITSKPKKRKLYKAILLHRFIHKGTPKEKTQEELAKLLNIKRQWIQTNEKELLEDLKKHFRSLGMGVTQRGKIKIEDYKKVLKDPEDSKSFKDEMTIPSRASDRTEKVLDLLAEGKDVGTIAVELKGIENPPAVKDVTEIKNQYFDDQYEDWYKEKVRLVKTAIEKIKRFAATVTFPELKKELDYHKILSKPENEKIFKDFVKDKKLKPLTEKILLELAANRSLSDISRETKMPVPYIEGLRSKQFKDVFEEWIGDAIEKEEVTEVVKAGHMAMAEDAIDNKDASVLVEFDPGPPFVYKSYHVSIKRERSFGKSKYTLNYQYDQPVAENGELKGQGISSLELNGKKASATNEVKKFLDEQVKSEIVSQGMHPETRGGYTFHYKSKKEKYPIGVGMFKRLYPERTIDPTHQKRIEEHKEFKEKLHAPLETREREDILIILRKLQDEYSSALKQKDTEAAGKLKEQIKEIKDRLKKHDDLMLKDIEDIVKEEKMRRMLKAAILPPQSDKAKELASLVHSYGVHKPTLEGLLTTEDMLVLAKVLRGKMQEKMKSDIKALKEIKKSEREARAKEIEKKFHDDVNKAVELIKHLPEDMKHRLDTMKKKEPESLKSLFIGKFDWLDSKERIDSIIKKMTDSLTQELILDKKEKQKPVTVIERPKFVSMEHVLEEELDRIGFIAHKLKGSSIEPKERSKEVTETYNKLTKEREDHLNTLRELVKGIDENNLSSEDAKIINDLRSKIHSLKPLIQKYTPKGYPRERVLPKKPGERPETILVTPPESEAEQYGKFLQGAIHDFAELYNVFSRFLWFKEKEVYAAAEVEKPIEEKPSVDKNLKDKIVNLAESLSGKPLRSKEVIDGLITKLKASLRDFVGEYGLSATTAGDREKAIEKAMIPEADLMHANRLIDRLREKKMVSDAEIAERELSKIKTNITEAFKEGLPITRVRELAEKKGIELTEARELLKKLEDNLVTVAFQKFVSTWTDKLEHPRKKEERSPLGNLPAEHYGEMGDYVEHHIPQLFEIKPPEKAPEAPVWGIPTPKDLRELIEKKYMVAKPKEMMREVFQEEVDDWDLGGEGKGGGPKRKKRHDKGAKVEVAKATWEELKEIIKKHLKTAPSHETVMRLMANYTKKIQNQLRMLKEGEYIDPEAVLDGFIHMLKRDLYNVIVNLRVGPSVPEKWSGPLPFSGTPDIVVDTYKEVDNLFDKIVGIYDEINHYIEPDKIAFPKADLSQIRTKGIAKFLPEGVTYWANRFYDSEKGKKSSMMSYRIAQRFIAEQVPKDELEMILS